MRLRHIVQVAFALLAEAAWAQAQPADPRPRDRGFPLMRLYEDTDHGGSPQNFSVAMDARGYVYVGNLQGLLISDGAHWRRAASQTAAYAVAAGPSGQVLTGGPQSLLRLEPGVHGVPTLRSIRELLPPKERDFGDVRTIVPTANGFVVLTDARLLLYANDELRTLTEIDRGSPAALFRFQGDVVFVVPGGIKRVLDGELADLVELNALKGHRTDAMLTESGGSALVVLRDRGLARVRKDGLTFLPGAVTSWALRNIVTSAVRLHDGRIAFGSKGGGVLLANDQGDAEQIIDSSRGLPDDHVTELTEDREGGLWVAMNSGLARLEVASAITVFDARAGVLGGSNGVFRHQGRLYVFSSTGLGVMENGLLRKIPGVSGSTWWGLDTPERPDEFLLASAAGIFRVAQDHAVLLQGTADIGAYVLARATSFDGILVGARGGLHVLKPTPSGYQLIGPLAGSPRYVRSIEARPSGRVFFSTTFDGIGEVDIDPTQPGSAVFRKLGGVEGYVQDGPDGLIAITNDERTEIFGIDEKIPRLVRDETHTRALAGLTAWTLASDASGNLWVNTNPLRVFQRVNGTVSAVPTVMHAFPARRVQVIKPESDGVVWICGESGLFRHAGPPGGAVPLPPSPTLTSVTVDDQLVFDGWSDSVHRPSELKQTLRRFHAEFGPLSHQRGLSYQFRLDPLDGEWSDWSPRTDVEFTTLPEASYRFRVRTRGADGEVSPEMEWNFVVNPPWHRTLVARLGSIFALILLLASAVIVRTRVLRREADRLALNVEEKTRDLQDAIRELEESRGRVEEQNRLLEAANARLEDVSRQDSLTGIANRRQFDLVLQEEWLRARRQRIPLAIGILDLDHFKELNDAHGHPEGDEALRRVAKTLQSTMRRPADLVARYGGEEFAFVLSDTDLAGALLVAEEVRGRIEALKLRSPGAPSGFLTASVGLVASIPAEGVSRERLVEAADRALYAAKASGRNRVRAAEVSAE